MNRNSPASDPDGRINKDINSYYNYCHYVQKKKGMEDILKRTQIKHLEIKLQCLK